MLTPEYLWSVADPVVDIWEELNKWALMDICERIVEADLYNFNALPGTARYRAWLLEQSGMHYEKMITVISALTKKSEEEVKRLFEEAGLLALENDAPAYEQNGIIIPPLQSNQSLLRILNNAYVQTNGEMKNYTGTTLDSSNKQCINALDKSYVEVSSGMRSYSEVIKETVDDLAKTGTVVTYPTGHKDSIETAVRRAVLTGINQGTMKMTLECAIQNGYEYVLVDAHIGARVNDEDKIANHAGWQGKIYKIIGSDENYGNLEEETGFPNNPLGLGGYNCRHHIYPHILGDPNTWEKNIPDEEENKKAYELSQKQRYMERKIRETKRNLLGLETCIEHCPDERTKFDLQLEYNKKAAVLQRQNQRYNEFCEKNELRPEQERLKAEGWNREASNNARSGSNQYKNAKTNSNRIDKNEIQSNMSDVTEEWFKNATPNSHDVINLEEYTVGNNTYKVDGKSVLLDHDSHEKYIAKLLRSTLGGEIKLVPRVLNPQNVSTPDYIFRGESLDLKTINGSSKNVIYNALNKKRRQANNFILDITNCPHDMTEIIRQIENVYRSNHTRFVKNIIIVKDEKIVKIYERKKLI